MGGGWQLGRPPPAHAQLSASPITVAAIIIRVKVKPNSRSSSLVQLPDGSWVAQVRAQASEGKANKELIALVASHFHCVKADVSIKSGASGRVKLIRIEAG
jgi:uncharacterized protein